MTIIGGKKWEIQPGIGKMHWNILKNQYEIETKILSYTKMANTIMTMDHRSLIRVLNVFSRIFIADGIERGIKYFDDINADDFFLDIHIAKVLLRMDASSKYSK